jgi:hypothetical protein
MPSLTTKHPSAKKLAACSSLQALHSTGKAVEISHRTYNREHTKDTVHSSQLTFATTCYKVGPLDPIRGPK